MRKLSLLLILITLISCDSDNETPNTVDFDKSSMLEAYADEYIIPYYSDLNESIQLLKSSWGIYKSDRNASNYDELMNSLKAVYNSWQYVGMLNFGPAANNHFFEFEFNIYPCDTNQIFSNIESGNWNLDAGANLSAKGLPALDFLFSKTDPEMSESFIQYIDDLIIRMENISESNLNDWQSSYRSTFISNSSNDRSSSFSLLINTLNKYYERDLRDGKLGIPLGVRSLGEAQPERIEAKYSGFSDELLSTSITAYELLYTNGDKLGIDDYIIAIGDNYMNGELDQKIKSQFASIRNEMNSLNNSIDILVIENSQEMNSLYTEIQKMIPLMKVDIPSATGVLITYQDNDGD